MADSGRPGIPGGGEHETASIEETVTVRPPDIKGALWWLERRLPHLFGRHVAAAHGGRIDSDVNVKTEGRERFEIVLVDPLQGDPDGDSLDDEPGYDPAPVSEEQVAGGADS